MNDNSVGKKVELSVSKLDFVGLGFADKQKTRGLPPGLVPIPDSYLDGDLPEVELIVGDPTKFGAKTTAPQPEQTTEDESKLYKPKVSTWGVFPRPNNISETVWYLVFAESSCKVNHYSQPVCDTDKISVSNLPFFVLGLFSLEVEKLYVLEKF